MSELHCFHSWLVLSMVTVCRLCSAEKNRTRWFDDRHGVFEYHDMPSHLYCEHDQVWLEFFAIGQPVKFPVA